MFSKICGWCLCCWRFAFNDFTIFDAVVFFRLFDIWKPGPVGWADRKPGALGVMLDDVIAGVMVAICVAIAAYVAHGVMGV